MESVPHDWLFPRCKAVIHHGGAGTTAAGLRAGVPNLVVPFAADQPFWGSRVRALGAGPAPIPVRKLTADRLISALARSQEEAVRSASEELGHRIRAEAGVSRAVEIIEKHVREWKREV
jgi:UDP:flavonoid glycosyltransferase YjiC (YdhE family)